MTKIFSDLTPLLYYLVGVLLFSTRQIVHPSFRWMQSTSIQMLHCLNQYYVWILLRSYILIALDGEDVEKMHRHVTFSHESESVCPFLSFSLSGDANSTSLCCLVGRVMVTPKSSIKRSTLFMFGVVDTSSMPWLAFFPCRVDMGGSSYATDENRAISLAMYIEIIVFP